MKMKMKKKYLLSPGPTPVPEDVLLSMAAPVFHHRTPEFEALFAEVREGLKGVFKTGQEVLTLASSGTGAMEAAVVNLLSAGDKAIAIVGGKFGERWRDLCRTYAVEVEEINVEWGQAVDPQEIAARLEKDGRIKAVFTTYSETSTGVKTDLKKVAETVRAFPEVLLVTDAITGLGVMELPMDEWGVDVVVSGSQKALMLPPGLAFIALSDRAWRRVEANGSPRYYFDLRKEKKAHLKNQTAYTPAISLIVGLNVVLKRIISEGMENVVARHARLARAVRCAVKAMGLKLLAPGSPSDALTAVYAPQGIDAKEITSLMSKKHGVTIAGGQDHLKGKIFRIAHLGFADNFDVTTAISALELSLKELGFDIPLGVGLKAAQEELFSSD
jgi:aspartate aminotransferase-like enzyme